MQTKDNSIESYINRATFIIQKITETVDIPIQIVNDFYDMLKEYHKKPNGDKNMLWHIFNIRYHYTKGIPGNISELISIANCIMEYQNCKIEVAQDEITQDIHKIDFFFTFEGITYSIQTKTIRILKGMLSTLPDLRYITADYVSLIDIDGRDNFVIHCSNYIKVYDKISFKELRSLSSMYFYNNNLY